MKGLQGVLFVFAGIGVGFALIKQKMPKLLVIGVFILGLIFVFPRLK